MIFLFLLHDSSDVFYRYVAYYPVSSVFSDFCTASLVYGRCARVCSLFDVTCCLPY